MTGTGTVTQARGRAASQPPEREPGPAARTLPFAATGT